MPDGDNEGKKIHVSLEGGKAELDRMRKRMEEIEQGKDAEINKLQEELEKTKLTAEKAKELQETLDKLAEQEREEKRAEMKTTIEGSREKLGDEKTDELLEQLEKADAKELERIMFVATSLTDAWDKAKQLVDEQLTKAGLTQKSVEVKIKEKEKQKKKPSTGTVTLLPPLKKGDSVLTREYEDPFQMVEDLYTAIRTETDVTKKQKLEEVRDELWRKLWEGEAKEYRRTGRYNINFQREFVLDPEARKIMKRKGMI